MVTMRSLVALSVTAALVASAFAREPRQVATATAADVQDVLAAEAAGLVDVKFIPNDSRSAQVIVTNRSDRPLSLRLPAGFAGVPVLAQMGGQGAGGFGAGGVGGQAQNVGGGGVQNGGMGIGGGVGGGGPFSLPPERTRTLRVPTVCLEHGKREPSPRMPYRMTALDTCSSDPRVQDVMAALAGGAISQKVAQAAAWHLSSGRSWDQLTAEVISMAGGDPDVPFFTPAELMTARRFVEESTRRHPAADQSTSSSAG
jgi:hypothetical protein